MPFEDYDKFRRSRVILKQTGNPLGKGLLLCFVVILVAIGFWMNNQRQLDRILTDTMPLSDTTGSLTNKDEQKLIQLKMAFLKSFGVQLTITIANPLPQKNNENTPQNIGQTLQVYIAISPAEKSASIYVSPILASALGVDFVRVQEEYLSKQVASDNWKTGLQETLNTFTARLDNIAETQ